MAKKKNTTAIVLAIAAVFGILTLLWVATTSGSHFRAMVILISF